MKPIAGGAHVARASGSSGNQDNAASARAREKVAEEARQSDFPGLRGAVAKLIYNQLFRNFILAVIVLNAITLGLDTVDVITDSLNGWVGRVLFALDTVFLFIFVVEIGLRLFVQRLSYFKDGWNWFDLTVVGIALLPTSDGLSALRTLRVIRALRLLTLLPAMRSVIGGLIRALPGMFSAMILLGLIHYVYAVIGVQMFGGQLYGGYAGGDYDYFQDLGRATYTLFQIMTLESWSHGIVRPIMDVHPGFATPLYFVSYVILSAFAALNLFIGIIVNAMDTMKDQEESELSAEEVADPAQIAILEELRALRAEVAELKGSPSREA